MQLETLDDGVVVDLDTKEGAYKYVGRFLRNNGASSKVFASLRELYPEDEPLGGMLDFAGLPPSLTYENGAKGLLIGEFFEEVESYNPTYCGCGECDFCHRYPNEPETITEKVPVSWTTIKEIYAKVVDHFAGAGSAAEG